MVYALEAIYWILLGSAGGVLLGEMVRPAVVRQRRRDDRDARA